MDDISASGGDRGPTDDCMQADQWLQITKDLVAHNLVDSKHFGKQAVEFVLVLCGTDLLIAITNVLLTS
jgi:hypothetical protein